MAFGIRNPFDNTHMPEHMVESQRKYKNYNNKAILIGIIGTIITILIMPIITFHFIYGINQNSWKITYDFFEAIFTGNIIAAHVYFINNHMPTLIGILKSRLVDAIAFYTLSILFSFFIWFSPLLFNPYVKISQKGGHARWATNQDLDEMEGRKQVGIKGGQLMALGRWQRNGKNKGKMVKMIETLSALCLAPPGTGKTAGFVVPTIVSDDNISFIVNDPKPELYDMTAGYREQISNVFMINWSKTDDPKNGIFYPRFNFLSPLLVPPDGPDRDTYLDAVANILIPEKNGSGDDYFVSKGRASLVGFMHYIVSKVGSDKPFEQRYDGIPKKWWGKEPSLPMLAEWIAVNQYEKTKKDENQENDEMMGFPEDKLGQWIGALCAEVSESGPFTSLRAMMELSVLVNMADKERSGVLGSMDKAMIPFKNGAVAQRTSACDFIPDDLRGMYNPIRKRVEPVTLYICVNQAEAQAFSIITSLLYEVLSKTFLSYGPGEYNQKTKRTLGPFPVCFCMDEFAKLPKIDAVMEGPDLGRSKKTSYMLVAQDYGQIEKIYKKEDVEIITSTTAVKYILSQNNASTAERIQKTVGKTTIEQSNKSFQEGVSKSANPLAWSRSQTNEAIEFLRTEDIMGMNPKEVIVIAQNFSNKPMKLKIPFFFEDQELSKKVRSRGKGPEPTQYIPEHMRLKRLEEYIKEQEKIKEECIKDIKDDDIRYKMTKEEVLNGA